MSVFPDQIGRYKCRQLLDQDLLQFVPLYLPWLFLDLSDYKMRRKLSQIWVDLDSLLLRIA